MGLQWKTKDQIAADKAAEEAVAVLGIPANAKIIVPPAKPPTPAKKASPLKGTTKPVADPLTKALSNGSANVGAAAKAAPKLSAIQEAVKTAPVKAVPAVHKPKLAGKAVVTDEMKVVDELVSLDQWMQQHEVDAKVKRIGELKKVLQSIAADMPATTDATITGVVGEVTFGPAKLMTTFNCSQTDLKAALGAEVYDQLASVTLTDAKKYLSEIEMDKLTDKEFGSRNLKTCKIK